MVYGGSIQPRNFSGSSYAALGSDSDKPTFVYDTVPFAFVLGLPIAETAC